MAINSPCSRSGFNPRLPHGRRPVPTKVRKEVIVVSIHASRTGGDGGAPQAKVTLDGFQSTPPAREATKMGKQIIPVTRVSIHASRTGGDR